MHQSSMFRVVDVLCVSKQAPSTIARHQQLNDLVTQAVVLAGMPAMKEPVDLIRQDGKRPDGITQIPWRSVKMSQL